MTHFWKKLGFQMETSLIKTVLKSKEMSDLDSTSEVTYFYTMPFSIF